MKSTPYEQAQCDFVKAYWAWKRREITEEPLPGAFGLHPEVGEGLARQVHIEFERQVVSRIINVRTKSEEPTRIGAGHQLALLGPVRPSDIAPPDEQGSAA